MASRHAKNTPHDAARSTAASTSLTKWRQRVGEERLLELLVETIATAQRAGHATQQDLARVNVDTTVPEKNITHPTDSKLYHRAIIKLGEAATQRGVKLCQTYVRVAKHAAIKVGTLTRSSSSGCVGS